MLRNSGKNEEQKQLMWIYDSKNSWNNQTSALKIIGIWLIVGFKFSLKIETTMGSTSGEKINLYG